MHAWNLIKEVVPQIRNLKLLRLPFEITSAQRTMTPDGQVANLLDTAAIREPFP